MMLFGFLRAVNVGGRTIKMDRLRDVLHAAGFERVETFIASGNLIVESAEDPAQVESRIEAALQDGFGLTIETFVRTQAELVTLAAAEPFGPVHEDHKVQVGFARAPFPEAARQAIADLATDYDELAVEGREVFWLTHGGMSGSLIKPTAFTKTLGVPVTFRNVTTLRRLIAKYFAP